MKNIFGIILVFVTITASAQLVPQVRNILHKARKFGKAQTNRLVELKNDAIDIIDDKLRQDFFAIYSHGAIITRNIQNRRVTEDKVTYFLYSSTDPQNYTVIDADNLERFRDTEDQIVFLIHGWTNSRESQWLHDLKDAFLVRDSNSSVIIVDWKDPANQFYYVSSINTFDVSEHITKLLVNLYRNYGVNKKNFLLVGHSLGGQIIGFVGKLFLKETQEKLPRIIALDPAGPLFLSRPIDKRLTKDDAEVVEVVHSDGGTFGYPSECGTIDFFPNGGSSQPGCKRIDLADLVGTFSDPITCDHRRAWAYFTEAILNPNTLVAQKCESWSKFKKGRCEKGSDVAMGDLSTTATGSYYLETNKDRPYSKTGSSNRPFNFLRFVGLG